jgi:hypothetical protein
MHVYINAVCVILLPSVSGGRTLSRDKAISQGQLIAAYIQTSNKDWRDMSLCMVNSLPLSNSLEHGSGSTINLEVS